MRWYTGNTTYDTTLTAALGLVALVALIAPFVPSPYGRFASSKFGLRLDPRLGWFLMELGSPLSFLYFFLGGPHRFETVPLLFLCLWCIHYGNRAFYFPLSIRSPRGAQANFSVMVMAIGVVVTTLHGYLNGSYFSTFGTHYGTAWLTDPRFLAGISLWAVSFALNVWCEAIVRNLRSKEEVAAGTKIYRIPTGGLYRFVTSPTYLTELCAWVGFALAAWSLGGVFILTVSAANLLPRAFATHKWYRARFPDYPPERKALLPFLL